MYHCILCGFDVEADDTQVPTKNGKCICLRCLSRVTINEHPMPASLRLQIERTVKDAP